MGPFSVKISVLLLVFFISNQSPALMGQILPQSESDSLIQSGIELSIQHDYEKAEAIFTHLITDRPEGPAGYFYMAATLQAKMMDLESDEWETDFHDYIRLAIRQAKAKTSDQQPDDSWSWFYEGSAWCYLAFYEGRQKDYFAALKHAVSGISILNRLLDQHPDFYDAYFGIGSYKYWRSKATRYLNWLPILADERQKGIEMVRVAVEKGKFTRYVAINELIWMLMDYGRPEEAYHYALLGLERFPQSRFFLWGAAKTAMVLSRFPEAANHYQQLLESIIKTPGNNHYNEFICRLNLAYCFERLGQHPEAIHQIKVIDSLSISPGIEKKLTNHRKAVIQIKKRLMSLALLKAPSDSLMDKGYYQQGYQ